ncbi:MAG: hypothetical protein O7B99_11540, partial [Planctomycetota bacterium]|nr:hypothetical protein [Planctomycetota bacterium]
MKRLLSIATALLALPSAGSGQEKLFARLHEMLPNHGLGTIDVAAGDVDLDGDFDLLILRYSYQI